MASSTFILDENIIVLVMAQSRVEYQSGRYVRIGEPYLDAYELLTQIERNGHCLALGIELSDHYVRHRFLFTRNRLAFSVDPMGRISRLQSEGRVQFVPNPPEIPLPDAFPDDDRYLAYLAVAAGAVLVTEDPGVLEASAGRALGFEAVTIGEALVRARVRS